MVRIAIAGGTGELASEIIEALVAKGTHEINILTRKASSELDTLPGILKTTVDYDDHATLVNALEGVDTVLSFINPSQEDPVNSSQKQLIDACIAAGVRRFAPSEFGSRGKDNLPFWEAKQHVHRYLQEVNKHHKTLEYMLFQPGLFLDYLASPHQTSKVTPLDTFIDFQNCRAIIVNGHEDAILTVTAVRDIAQVVALAVDHAGEWPEYGGIQGNRVTVSQIIQIGEKVRGQPFAVEKVNLEDLEAGQLKTSWTLGKRHPGFSEAQTSALANMLKTVMIGTLLSCAKGAWDVSDELNKILPDYEFAHVEEFLAEVWQGKP